MISYLLVSISFSSIFGSAFEIDDDGLFCFCLFPCPIRAGGGEFGNGVSTIFSFLKVLRSLNGPRPGLTEPESLAGATR